MNSLLASIVILSTAAAVVVQATCPYSNPLTLAQIKAGTNEGNAWELTGIGGRYGTLKRMLSKARVIESDHFPQKSAYADAASAAIKALSEDDMAAVSVRYAFHRSFITTGNTNVHKDLKAWFSSGNYLEAIRQNIKFYVDNPSRATGDSREGNLNILSEGIVMGLAVHVKNGLITQKEMDTLIGEFDLFRYQRMAVTHLVNLPRRDAAREYVKCG